MWEAFRTNYLPETPRMRLRGHELHTSSEDGKGVTKISAQLLVDGLAVTVNGVGDGPIEAFVHGLRDSFASPIAHGPTVAATGFDVTDYAEHAMGRGSDATAVAYVESISSDGQTCWGIGIDPNITTASLRAVLSAFERQQA
jgi:2-isopropylmalate synthase